MDTTLLLLCCGLLVGFSGAQTSSPNPECADLIALKKHAERGIKLYPGASLHCNPNKNCSGLSCNGKIGKKSFKGTVILQGCKDPVTLLVHIGNREFVIRDNQKTKISSTLQMVTRLKKVDDSVYVTVTLDPCLLKCGGPLKYNVVKNQRIRVRCNSSNIRSPATRMPPASLEKPNPECKGLINTKKSVERHFNQIGGIFSPGSKIRCHPNKKCSELDCTGVVNKDHFNATATIEYCSPPIRMRLKVDVPNKNLHFDHDFRDGQKVEVSKMPPVFVVVRLKRIENVVYVTVSGTVLVVPYTLVKNMSITVDPSHCPGYHAPVRYPRCKGLLTLGKSIENRMSKLGEPERMFATCKTDKQCNELSCHGKFRNDEFHSVASLDYCSSPTILHMRIVEGNHTYIHAFKDGNTSKMPYPMTVGLKRTGNNIAVNISIARYFLVRNVIVSVDPSYCSKPGLLVGFSGAQTSSPNPECADLIALKKHAESGIKLYPGASLHCNPNKNCSGLSCNGKIGKKSFKGTVILQGCKDPVTLLVHFGNRAFVVRDNQKTKISSTLQVVTRLKKVDGSVYVTETLVAGPLKYDIVKNQRIRVRCNGSNIRSPATRMPPASLVKPNPECKGLINTKKSVERHFNQISGILSPGSKISCHPNKKCSELDCTGVANKDHFNATATIEYCSPPIRMRLKVDVPNKNLHSDHDFRDGQKVEVSKMPPAFVVVRLERIENVVYVTVSGTVLAIPYTLVKNMSITVDPSHCPGYIAPVRYPRCKGLLTLGKSIENRMSKFGEPERTFATCKTDEQCNELSCHGKFRNHEFHSVASLDYCSSPTILHMHIEEGNHTHAFKDGDTFNMPHPMTVGLKRTGNDIVVNISIAKYVLVQNVIVSVDPNYCSKPGGKSKSLSGAMTALIVLSAIIFIASVTGLVVWLRKTKRFSLRRPARYNDLAMSDDGNPLYDDFEPAMA